MKNYIQNIISQQLSGITCGIYSICSAHPYVLKAAFQRAKKDGSALLIEATSNQVNQFGGYTGMNPAGFIKYVYEIALDCSFPLENLILGGDHLGPNTWQREVSETAMKHSKVMVADYVAAGFRKIHLDASMHCADDKVFEGMPLDDEIVAKRAAALCLSAEEAYKTSRECGKPVYVIGTEVPVPGGTQNAEEELRITTAEDVSKTLEITKAAFIKAGLEEAWQRVVAIVVQPGVEFGDDKIINYEREKAAGLTEFIQKNDGLTFEAHSTDYQTQSALNQMVEDQFSILKVGPWLTYAYREALFALSEIEREICKSASIYSCSSVKEALDMIMVQKPEQWQKYFNGNEYEKELSRKYSLSDRARYYWGNDKIKNEVSKLILNLSESEIPLTVLNQFMPNQYSAVRNGEIKNDPESLILHKIDEIIHIYSKACRNS